MLELVNKNGEMLVRVQQAEAEATKLREAHTTTRHGFGASPQGLVRGRAAAGGQANGTGAAGAARGPSGAGSTTDTATAGATNTTATSVL